ncbi:hypothetical protein N1851_005474 [Merluccius polli]|uniref:Retropepsins domain-containing protein n=1 Tax=Merluccius polli TaxID=89951 RepID=A0AA47N6P4_MERPO|nr:hypothetical protein N1851_005474 [Merluccius polli]
MLKRELRRHMHLHPSSSFFDIRSEALRWRTTEGEANLNTISAKPNTEVSELKECLVRQQAQLDAIMHRLDLSAHRTRSGSNTHALEWQCPGRPFSAPFSVRWDPYLFALQPTRSYGQGLLDYTTSVISATATSRWCKCAGRNTVGKLTPSDATAHASEGVLLGRPSQTAPTLLGNCPVVEILIEGIAVPCLLDTGSMVTTITEEFFEQRLQPHLKTPLNPCSWLTLKGANGLKIPYRGYVELEIQILGRVLPKMGILVVTVTSPPNLKKAASQAY